MKNMPANFVGSCIKFVMKLLADAILCFSKLCFHLTKLKFPLHLESLGIDFRTLIQTVLRASRLVLSVFLSLLW